MSTDFAEETGLYKEILFHSRLPLNAFFDFSINHNRKNYEGMDIDVAITHGLLSKRQWQDILGKDNSVIKQTEDYATVSEELEKLNNKEQSIVDKDGDYMMQDEIFDNFSDFDSYNDNFNHLVGGKNEKYTIFVYSTSFSIDNEFFYLLPCPIEASAVIKGKLNTEDDTLLLSLNSSKILLIRFSYDDNTRNFRPYVVFDYMTKAGELSDIQVSNRNDMVFFVHKTVIETFKIHYNKNKIPFLLKHYNIPENVITGSLVSISSSQEALVYSSLEKNNTLSINCLQNFDNVKDLKRNKIIMRNTFDVPLQVISLSSTNSVLFLQESGYTIKLNNFLTDSEGTKILKFDYPETKRKFSLNSYYLPKRKIILKRITKLPQDSYTHDQVLISTSNNRTVFLLDVIYNLEKNTVVSQMTRLFKYKHTISFFKFEVIEDTTNYEFIFANEMGITESKIVNIIVENDIPILRSVTADKWSSIYPYPLIDFKCIQSPKMQKPSIEDPTNEFWALGGFESNSSIFKFRSGYTGKVIITLNENVVTSRSSNVFSLKNNLILLTSEESNLLFKYVTAESRFEFQSSLDIKEKAMSCNYVNDKLVVIFSRHIIVFNEDNNIVHQFALPGKCISTSSIENTISMYYHMKETNKHGIVVFNVRENEEGGITFNSVEFNDDDFEYRKLSMIKTLLIRGDTFLFLGSLDGFVVIYKLFESRQFVKLFSTEKVECLKTEVGELKLRTQVFRPHDITILNNDDLLLLTSKEGKCSIIKLNEGNLDRETDWIVLNTFNLSNCCNVDIIGTQVEGTLLLKCKYLWKINLKESFYPKRVLFSDNFDSQILGCCKLIGNGGNGNDILILRDGSLSLSSVSISNGTLVKHKKLNSTPMKLIHLPHNNLFMIISIPGTKESEPIQFFDPKKMKLLKNSKNSVKVFEEEEVPICASEWKICDDTTGKKYVNVIIGCLKKNDEGSLKFLQISRNKDNEIDMKFVFSTVKAKKPVTDIKYFPQSKYFFASMGNEINQYGFDFDTKRLSGDSSQFFTASGNIKRFQIHQSIQSDEDDEKLFELLIVLQNNTVFKVKTKIKNSTKTILSTNFSSSDVICLNNNELIISDYHSGKIRVCDDQLNEKFSTSVGYTPRLSAVSSFPPWIPTKSRSFKYNRKFITVGLNGEVTLFVRCKKDEVSNHAGNPRKRKIVELCHYKDSLDEVDNIVVKKDHQLNATAKSLEEDLLYNLIDV